MTCIKFRGPWVSRAEDQELMEIRQRFEEEMRAMRSRFEELCAGLRSDHNKGQEQMHAENRTRLQFIDQQAIENGKQLVEIKEVLAAQDVKMSSLYGNGSGRKGAVEKLAEKVDRIGDKIIYAMGGFSTVVLLVGWYLEAQKGK
jgi:hypothetical protein